MNNFIPKIASMMLVLMLSFFLKLSAIPAYPYPIEIKQPNGETITIKLQGDEFFHYATTEDGYVIIQDQDGYYTYATLDEKGVLNPSFSRVSDNQLKSSLSGLIKADSEEFHEKVAKQVFRKIHKERMIKNATNQSLRSATGITGTKKGLVILVNFTDKKFNGPSPDAAFSDMLNQSGYSANSATGSARDFYMDNSGNQFIPQFDVYGPVDLPQNVAYYGVNGANGNDKNAEQMVIDACKLVKSNYAINFADYDNDKDGFVDNVFVFYAGYNEAESGDANTIWPHQYWVPKGNKIDGVELSSYACTSELRGSAGNTMAGIGTFTHEFGHVLGLPDLYDADGSDNGSGIGIGAWATMASGGYLNNGRTPPYFGAIERWILGWINLSVLSPQDQNQNIIIRPLSTENKAYVIETPTPDEFFSFEVRKNGAGTGWDQSLPGQGMLVYHIDMTDIQRLPYDDPTYPIVSAWDLWSAGIPNIIGNHQCMDLLKANNTTSYNTVTYPGQPYPGSNNITTLSDETMPSLKSWAGEKSGAVISNITRNSSTGDVSFVLAKAAANAITSVSAGSAIISTDGRFIRFENVEGKSTVEIYDISGRLCLKSIVEGTACLPVSQPGIYIVKMIINNQTYYRKVIVK